MRPDRPSLTARWVAAHRARLHDRPTIPGGDPEAERRLYDGLASRLLVLPGLAPTGIVERTAFFDRETVTAIGRDFPQVVVVGAGYDGRAVRFGGGATHWIELDYPSTQDDKRARLAGAGADLSFLTFAPIDLLAGDLGAVLAGAGHRPDRPTLFICEGLFAYLTFEACVSLCTTLAGRAHADSVLAANFRVAPAAGPRGAALRRVVDGALALLGEHRKTDFRPGDPERLLAESGWTIIRRDASRPSRLDEGSHLLVVAATPTGPVV